MGRPAPNFLNLRKSQHAPAHVSILFARSGPLTKTLAIYQGVVFAMQRSSQRAQAHILQEIAEVKPAVTNFNSAPSIVSKIWALGLVQRWIIAIHDL